MDTGCTIIFCGTLEFLEALRVNAGVKLEGSMSGIRKSFGVLFTMMLLFGVMGAADAEARPHRGGHYSGGHHQTARPHHNHYPRPSVVVVAPVAPGPNYVWVEGRWEDTWAGPVWRDGYWMQVAPAPLWIEGRWAYQRGYRVWLPGYWR